MNPLQWMCAVRIRAVKKKHYNDIHLIHISLSLHILWVKSCVFVKKKTLLLSKIHYNASFCICLELFSLVNGAWSVHISFLIQNFFFWRTQFYGLRTHILAGSNGLKLKHLMIDLFPTNTQLFTSQDVNWWTGVVWITCGLLWCFISCLDAHSDGTHSLQRIHWWASGVNSSK